MVQWFVPLGNGVTVARLALDQLVLVRIQVPQPAWSHRLGAQDAWFSATRPGFKSPWDYQQNLPNGGFFALLELVRPFLARLYSACLSER